MNSMAKSKGYQELERQEDSDDKEDLEKAAKKRLSSGALLDGDPFEEMGLPSVFRPGCCVKAPIQAPSLDDDTKKNKDGKGKAGDGATEEEGSYDGLPAEDV